MSWKDTILSTVVLVVLGAIVTIGMAYLMDVAYKWRLWRHIKKDLKARKKEIKL